MGCLQSRLTFPHKDTPPTRMLTGPRGHCQRKRKVLGKKGDSTQTTGAEIHKPGLSLGQESFHSHDDGAVTPRWARMCTGQGPAPR